MRDKEHHYTVTVEWAGNQGTGTSAYDHYSRDHIISAEHKHDILGSSDPAFLGNASRWNPEDLLIAAASACHKLWYLHLCASVGVIVESYVDHAEGVMDERVGHGQFTSITLKPQIVIAAGSNPKIAIDLHHKAHQLCYVANTLNCPVTCIAKIVVNESEVSYR